MEKDTPNIAPHNIIATTIYSVPTKARNNTIFLKTLLKRTPQYKNLIGVCTTAQKRCCFKSLFAPVGSWTVFPFRREQAFETAGKIAYMIAKIKCGDTLPLLHFDAQTMQLKDFFIQAPDYNFLNKKVKFANDALFYWFQAVELLLK